MSNLLHKWSVFSYKIYKWRLNQINKKRLKKGQFPICDKRGYPWKSINIKGLPTLEEIRENRKSIKPLGVLMYIDFNINQNK